ncbi:MAG: hypothetical protein ACJA0G_000304 [Kangiellaceae bacterium]|jgi:hypothetical protein
MSKPTSSPVHPDQHAGLKIKEQIDFTALAQRQFAALTVQEFAQAASSYPVVLLKDGQTGAFVSVALWGFEAEQNVLLNASDNVWDAVHLPNEVQCEPFLLGPCVSDPKTLTMHINEASALVQKEEGHVLFDNEGETAYLKSMQAKLSEHYQNQVFTRDFINLMLEKNLLKEIEIMVAYQDDKVRRVKGLYTIDEEALSALDETTVVSFFKRNLFVPIYAMLGSLTQFNRLMKSNNKNDTYVKIARLQMRTPGAE